jgi:hypothetical protein
MTTFERGTARREGVINADIGNVWTLITDWGNLDWWGNDIEQEDMRAARVYLEGEKGKVPRTKVIERSNSGESGAVHVNREVLIHEDPAAHRLYYTCSDGLLVGVRNYLASWTLDALDGGRCRMRITADFDVSEPGNLDFSRNTFEQVYELIFKGLDHYLAQRGGKYVPAE